MFDESREHISQASWMDHQKGATRSKRSASPPDTLLVWPGDPARKSAESMRDWAQKARIRAKCRVGVVGGHQHRATPSRSFHYQSIKWFNPPNEPHCPMSHFLDRAPYSSLRAAAALDDRAPYYLSSHADWRAPLLQPAAAAAPRHYIPTPASYASPWHPVNFTCQPEYNSHPHSHSRSHAPSPPYLLDPLSDDLGACAYTAPLTRPASRASVSVSTYSTSYATAAGASSPASGSSGSSSAAPPSPPPPAAPAPAVKQELPDDDGFIMDAASTFGPLASAFVCAPPTEVPLRATQAGRRMRRMMGVFRLNPFAIQGGRKGTGAAAAADACTWAGGEARPLEEPPQLFEFQVVLERPLLPEVAGDDEDEGDDGRARARGRRVKEAKCEQPEDGYGFGYEFGGESGFHVGQGMPPDAPNLHGLRAFSPDFGLDAEPELEQEPSWELAYPPTPPPVHANVFDPAAAYPRALHNAAAHPYLVRPVPAPRPPIHTHTHTHVQGRTRGYDASASRRWSLPAHAHTQGSAAFLM
ncbi:hypothetical protein GGX14DRAFT_698748 [Mycena pura]|uniref:Uncharacterized protein n=1 Tax=Mycena pura TaxID=153505 RepID=A0AAD6VBC6_9AGAR|nr:hypothetical protein GGX14DRAFT_698748 [Mycena pura]